MIMKIIAVFALILLAPRLLRAEPITLKTPSGMLYGTLELPKNPAPCPVALILAGSGATNRDGDTLSLGGENDSLRLLAEGLAAHGIASVRYDKRGVAASAQAGLKEADLRFETYIDDAVLWGQQLQHNRRFSRLVVVGHSEGSLIGMVAARTLRAEAFISIAGAGRAAGEVILDQLRRQLSGELMQQSEGIVESLNGGKTIEAVPQMLSSLFRPSVQPYLISWFRYDPAKEIAMLAVPVLVVQGTTDLQVSVQDARLLSNANPRAKLCIIDGMNHVLKNVAGDKEKQMRSYLDPALPVSAPLIVEASQFIKGLESHQSSKPVPR